MDHPKDVGDRSTLAVMTALVDAGYQIAVPFGENTRYDLVADDGTWLQRIQCKTGRLRSGAIRFMTSSSYCHHMSPQEPHGPISDRSTALASTAPTSGVYLVPIDEVPTTTNALLRVEPSRNGQQRRIRQAATYEIGRVSVGATRALRGSSGARGSSA